MRARLSTLVSYQFEETVPMVKKRNRVVTAYSETTACTRKVNFGSRHHVVAVVNCIIVQGHLTA